MEGERANVISTYFAAPLLGMVLAGEPRLKKRPKEHQDRQGKPLRFLAVRPPNGLPAWQNAKLGMVQTQATLP
jgi:hypothetical protein